MYVTESAMKRAAVLSRRGPILSHTVAFVISILFKNFSTFSFEISGIVKRMPSRNLLLQKCLSFSKLEVSIGSFKFDAMDRKKTC